MSTYEVFHAYDLFRAFWSTPARQLAPVEREQYHKVADVQARDLE